MVRLYLRLFAMTMGFIGLLNGCGFHESRSQLTATAAGDVALIEEGVPLVASDLVFAVGAILHPEYLDAGVVNTFRASVTDLVRSRYVGYTLPSAVNAQGKHAFVGPLKAFHARYADTSKSIDWKTSGETPAQPNFAEIDKREMASSPVLLDKGHIKVDTLRLYLLQVRTGFVSERYTYDSALLALRVDPSSGARGVFFLAKTDGRMELFKVAASSLPTILEQTSVINVVKAADTMTAIQPTSGQRFVVPFHNYVMEAYRVLDGQSFRGTSTPYGRPLTLGADDVMVLGDAWARLGDTQFAPELVDRLDSVLARQQERR